MNHLKQNEFTNTNEVHSGVADPQKVIEGDDSFRTESDDNDVEIEIKDKNSAELPFSQKSD